MWLPLPVHQNCGFCVLSGLYLDCGFQFQSDMYIPELWLPLPAWPLPELWLRLPDWPAPDCGLHFSCTWTVASASSVPVLWLPLPLTLHHTPCLDRLMAGMSCRELCAVHNVRPSRLRTLTSGTPPHISWLGGAHPAPWPFTPSNSESDPPRLRHNGASSLTVFRF